MRSIPWILPQQLDSAAGSTGVIRSFEVSRVAISRWTICPSARATRWPSTRGVMATDLANSYPHFMQTRSTPGSNATSLPQVGQRNSSMDDLDMTRAEKAICQKALSPSLLERPDQLTETAFDYGPSSSIIQSELRKSTSSS